MALTAFSDLVTTVTAAAFPFGEAENLVDQHRKNIIEGIIDIQRWCECWQRNNVTVVPNCGQLFQCGQTVITAPRGNIFRVSTFDQIDPETGLQDPNKPVSWCDEVEYKMVPYCRLKKLVDEILCAHRSCLPVAGPLQCGYPVPTNAGYEGYPELPLGFQYPQASLDRTGTCIVGGCARSRTGVWAMENGRIYIAPWLQSTEVLAIQWNGIKRTWADADLISDDPTFVQAVQYFLLWCHERDYERDFQQSAIYEVEYRKLLATLIRDCREETRDHSCEQSLAKQIPNSLQSQSPGPIVSDVPIAPTGLSTTPIGNNRIDLHWEFEGDNQQGFIVYQKFGDEWIKIRQTYQMAISVLNLESATEYCFQVRAFNTMGNSEASDEICETTGASPNRYNVDFNSVYPTPQEGAAAAGNTGDFWNSFCAVQGGLLMNLRRADGTYSSVTLQDTGAQGGDFGDNGNADAMLASWFGLKTSPFQKQFTVRNLPTGTYHIYLYGWGDSVGSAAAGKFLIHINGVQWPNGSTSFVVTDNNDGAWVSGGNYVRATSVPIVSGDVLSITAFYTSGTAYGFISGFQIVPT